MTGRKKGPEEKGTTGIMKKVLSGRMSREPVGCGMGAAQVRG